MIKSYFVIRYLRANKLTRDYRGESFVHLCLISLFISQIFALDLID